MLAETERAAMGHADRFKQAIPQQKAAVAQWHHSLRLGQKLYVEKNNHEINPFLLAD